MGVLKVWDSSTSTWRKVGCGVAPGPNLLTADQSGFESGTTTGWAVPAGFDAVLTAVTTPAAPAGSFCMAIEHTSTTGALPFTTPTGTAGMAVTPAATYSITAQFRTSSGGTLNCQTSWYNSAGTLIVANVLGEIPWSANDTWVAQSWTDTAPAGAAFLSVEFTVEHIDVNAKRAWIDVINVHATASPPGRLRLQRADGSWVREACAGDVRTQYVGGATGASLSSSVSLTAPAGIEAGDFLLVTGAAWSTNMDATDVAGYTPAGQNDGTRIFTRTADGTESGSTVTMTNGFGAGSHALALQVFRGPASFTTRGIQNSSSGTFTYDAPITGTGPGTFLLQETWCARVTGGVTITPPVELTHVLNVPVGDLCLVVGLEDQTVGGGAVTTTPRTATASVASAWESAIMSFPVGGHPLKIEDPANPGTWITVACMVPV